MVSKPSELCGLIALLLIPAVLALGQEGPSSAEQYHETARNALAAGDYDVARTAYEKLRDLDPGTAEIHANLGLIYFHQRLLEEAVNSLRRAISLKPNLAAARALLAISLAELGRYSEALPDLEKTFHHPSAPEARRMCGLQLMRAYDNLRRENEAVAIALELNRLYPDDPEILYQTGKVYGNYAFVTMHKLAQVAPDSIWRHQAAAEAYESEGSTDQAFVEYQTVLAKDPHRPGIHYRIGRTLLSQSLHAGSSGDTAAAEKEFAEELKIDPSNANAAYELGEINQKAGQFDKAREFFERALKYYPDFQQAQLGLGGTLLSLDRAAAAVPHLQRAAALDPEDEVPYYRLARAYKALGEEKQAREMLARFEKLHSTRQAEGTPQLASGTADITKQTVDPQNRN